MAILVECEEIPFVCKKCSNTNPFAIGTLDDGSDCDMCEDLWETNECFRSEF